MQGRFQGCFTVIWGGGLPPFTPGFPVFRSDDALHPQSMNEGAGPSPRMSGMGETSEGPLI